MADSTDTEEFKLDLDASDFISSAQSAVDAISAISDTEGLAELGSKIMEVGAIVGVLGTAFLAVKETMDLVFDAERIKQTNEEFETFANMSGVSADKLKKGLITAAQGWADEDEILQAANHAMVELGGSADKLPELMDAARKATALFGGTITENFERLTQAVASGRTITLRQMGLNVDQAQAQQKYAQSIGVTVSELTQQGKAQAILNAVLEQSKTAYAGVNTDITEAINSWTEFKSTLKDIGEIATLAWDKLAGPTVRNALSWLSDWAKQSKTWFQASFGEGADQAAAKTSILKDKINDLKVQIIDLEQQQIQNKDKGPHPYEQRAKQIEELNAELKSYENQLGETAQAEKKLADQDTNRSTAAAPAQNQAVDHQKQLQDQAAFEQKMLSLRLQRLQAEAQGETDADDAEKNYREQLAIQGQQIDAQISQIKAQAAAGDKLTAAQANQEIMQLEEIKKQKIEADEDQIAQIRLQSLNNYASQSKTVFEGITRGSAATSVSTMNDLKKFGNLGTDISKGFASHMSTAFQQMGSGAKSGTDAMTGAFFGMIGDVAGKYGEMMMLASIFPPNPPVFAAGAALEVLAGALGAAAGGGGTYQQNNASMTGSGVAGLPSTSLGNSAPSLTSQQQKNMVNITIQGHMFQTTETQNWMVNTIRAAADATDFNISSVN